MKLEKYGDRGSNASAQSFLLPTDGFEEPVESQARSCCPSFAAKAVYILGTGACLALRTADPSKWMKGLSSFGIGFFGQCAIETGFTGSTLARIRQVTSTLFGQMSFYAFSQGYANTDDEDAQRALVDADIALLGANTAILARGLYEQGAIRVESYYNRASSRVECVNHTLTHALKASASAALGAGSRYVKDPILKAFSTFLATFYGSQVIGERLIDAIDEKIAETDRQSQAISDPKGTPYRRLKTWLTTLGYIAKPLGFIPWSKPHSSERVHELLYVGLVLGFFNGINDRSQMRRIEKVQLENLDEFQLLEPPEKPRKGDKNWSKYIAYKVWSYAVPLLAVGGMSAFTGWQINDKLPGDTAAQATLAATLAGFLGSYSICKFIDEYWEPNSPNPLWDRAMTTLWVSPRIFGINPLYLYYAATNALEMNSNSLSVKSPYHLTAVAVGWVSYGISMGREFAITSSNRGCRQLKHPDMVIVNGAATAKLNM